MGKEYQRCPNCGRKGLILFEYCFIKKNTHKCKYCDMEFKKVIRKGEVVWRGEIPKFTIGRKK